jgi:hypothetical protein
MFKCELKNATPIRIGENQHLQNIDINLKNGVEISGSLVDSQTQQALIIDNSLLFGSSDNLIEVYDEAHTLKGIATSQGMNGFQVVGQLRPGKYFLRTGSNLLGKSNSNYINQIYDGSNCEGNICYFRDGQLLDLTEQDSLTDIQIELDLGYRISGMVSNSNGESIEDVEVAVLDMSGQLIANGKTQYDGSYSIGGLKTGHYYLRTFNGNKKNYESFEFEMVSTTSAWINQIYPNQDCNNNLCPLGIERLINIVDSSLSAMDFTLSQGVSISGHITDTLAGTGIPDVEIKLYSQEGGYIESYFSGTDGKYTTAAIDPGNYKLLTANEMHYVNQAYMGSDCGIGECNNPQMSETLTVLDQNIENVNFSLTKGQDFYPEFSGLWYNPNESGHGLQIEVLKTEGTATLLVSWYAMLDGQPIWLMGTGPLNKDLAFVNMSISSGTQFPPAFNADDVQLVDWGTAKLKFIDMNNLVISWQTAAPGFSDSELTMTRLSQLSHDRKDTSAIDGCMSGTYYNPAQNGHGIMLEVLGDNSERMVITWFVYNQGQQFWLLASGDINGNQADLTAIYTHGSDFPPNFDNTQVQKTEWGNVSITKIDNNSIQLDWSANNNHPDFASGSINMQRLTRIEGLGCE